ncbi:MAG: hypothetical protein AAGE85_11930 [Pseudomonadota bacterium]
MDLTQLVPVHVAAGALGLVSGAAAALLRKGSPSHVLAGKVFATTMLAMSGSGALIAYFAPTAASVVAGLLTFYLVSTGWMAIRTAPNTAGAFETGACAAGFAIAAYAIGGGLEASASSGGTKDGFPALIYFIFGGIAAFAAVLDVRVVVGRGLAGRQRIARHLWRMLFGLLMATSSFFLGQMQVFPEPLRKPPILALPVLAVIGLLVYWPLRVLLFSRAPKTGLNDASV